MDDCRVGKKRVVQKIGYLINQTHGGNVSFINKMNLGMGFLMIAAVMNMSAQAQESTASSASQSTIKSKDLGVKPQEGKDIDEDITNARLRATTGSKSKISIQTEMGYTGGSLIKPFDRVRPDLSPGALPDPVKITGSISGKYRVNDSDSINIGSGLSLLTPGYEGQRGQVDNPYITYGKAFKLNGLQNVLSVGFTNYTSESSKKADRTYNLSAAHTVLANLTDSKWQAGVAASIDYEIYSTFSAINEGALHTYLGIYPFAEYAFNDNYSFRTVYRGISFYTTRDAESTYRWDEATQSMGLGVALTRDIYLYPNIQWVWRDIRSDLTNVALSANINFF